VQSKPYFDKGIASLQHEDLSPAAADFEEGIVRHAEPVETDGRIAVVVENSTAPAKEQEPGSIPATAGLTTVSTPSEPRLEGVRAWFDYVMDRASQRFTLQARLVTVALSCVFVLAGHFDAVWLLRSMSQGAELRARLTATAEGIDKHAEQFSHSKPGAHTVVPDVYRQAMVSILRTVPRNPELNEARPQTKRKARAKEREKVAATAVPAEDSVTSEAKSKAMHALETSPGFASREDAESWLRKTLDGNPARETLAAAYQQEVNVELVSDSDKLIDESASLRSELARYEFKLFQDRPTWPPSPNEVPGLFVTVAFLSLGAAFCYNTLKKLASLRPQLAIRQDLESKHQRPA